MRYETVHPVTEDAPAAAAPRQVNLSALLAEAAAKSGVIWVEVPGERAHAVWHEWQDGAFLLVSGPGEQHLPWLPEDVSVALRSKDTGGRLLRVHARVERIDPDHPDYDAVAETLRAARLNATGDVRTRWAAECTIHRLRPYGSPTDTFDAPTGDPERAAAPGAAGTTARWLPWHWRGRPQRRRRQRG